MKKCCVIGLGYIGLPTSLLLAKNGIKVIGVDIKEDVINMLNIGEIHIIEKGLKPLLNQSIKSKSFLARNKPEMADVFLIAVPTPFKKNESDIPEPDLSYVFNAIESIFPFLRKGNLVIIESTSPVGTTDKIAEQIFSRTGLGKDDIHLSYCPERVLPGNIINELISNDRVIGGFTKKANQLTKEFYRSFCKGNFNETSSNIAELVKLTENSYRDVNIAFANEISIICDSYNIDVFELIKLCNYHPRVNILNPGCGVGGHCIAVDPWFIVSSNPIDSNLIKMSRNINDNKKTFVIRKVIEINDLLEQKLNRKPKIACMGLAFKPDVDDIRESPAMKITEHLILQDLLIYPCDPNVSERLEIKNYPIDFVLKNVDLFVFLVGHSAFEKLSINKELYLDFCGLFSHK
tara:strand:- start:155 stop:1369 length:1215 start_codon:yes stop_codon:yes gene_type:complete